MTHIHKNVNTMSFDVSLKVQNITKREMKETWELLEARKFQ